MEERDAAGGEAGERYGRHCESWKWKGRTGRGADAHRKDRGFGSVCGSIIAWVPLFRLRQVPRVMMKSPVAAMEHRFGGLVHHHGVTTVVLLLLLLNGWVACRGLCRRCLEWLHQRRAGKVR